MLTARQPMTLDESNAASTSMNYQAENALYARAVSNSFNKIYYQNYLPQHRSSDEALTQRNSQLAGDYPEENENYINTGLESSIELAYIDSEDAPIKKLALTGMGGVGKTSLALHLFLHAQNYQVKVWFNADSKTHLESQYKTFAITHKIVSAEDNMAIIKKKIINWFEHNPGWLIVYDDVDPKIKIKRFMPKTGGFVLLTHRFSRGNYRKIEPKEFEGVAPALIKQYILASDGSLSDINEEDIKTLAGLLDYLPLAMAQAGAYIGSNSITIQRYITLYQDRKNAYENKRALLKDNSLNELGEKQHVPVYLTWDITFEYLKRYQVNALGWLNMAVYFAPDNIPRSLFEIPDTLPSEALKILKNYALINLGTTVFSIHRVLRDVIQLKQDLNEQISHIKDALIRIESHYQYRHGTAHGNELSIHVETLVAYAKERHIDNDPLISCLYNLGKFYLHFYHDIMQALTYLKGALDLYHHLENNDQILLRQIERQYFKALSWSERTKEEAKKIADNWLEQIDSDTDSELLCDLADFYMKLKGSTTQPQLQNSNGMLDIGEKTLIPSTSQTKLYQSHAKRLLELAFNKLTGNMDDKTVTIDMVDVDKIPLSTVTDPTLARILHLWGNYKKQTRKISDAVASYRKALLLKMRCNAVSDIEVARTLHQLSKALWKRYQDKFSIINETSHDLNEAIELMKQALRLRRTYYQTYEHKDIAENIMLLGLFYDLSGYNENAILSFQWAESLRLRNISSSKDTKTMLAKVLVGRGHLDYVKKEMVTDRDSKEFKNFQESVSSSRQICHPQHREEHTYSCATNENDDGFANCLGLYDAGEVIFVREKRLNKATIIKAKKAFEARTANNEEFGSINKRLMTSETWGQLGNIHDGWLHNDGIQHLLASKYLVNIDSEKYQIVVPVDVFQNWWDLTHQFITLIDEQLVSEGHLRPYMIVPINFGNRHWAGLIIEQNFQNLNNPSVYFFDSLGSNPQKLNTIRTIITDTQIFTNPTMIDLSSSQLIQGDGSSCGTWMLEFMRAVMEISLERSGSGNDELMRRVHEKLKAIDFEEQHYINVNKQLEFFGDTRGLVLDLQNTGKEEKESNKYKYTPNPHQKKVDLGSKPQDILGPWAIKVQNMYNSSIIVNQEVPPQFPETWNMPYQIEHYVERDSIKEIIWGKLNGFDTRKTVNLVGLHGLGGVGKTILAAHIIHYPLKEYKFRGWFRAESEELLKADYCNLGDDLQLFASDIQEQQKIRKVKQWLENMDKTLLIYDNAPDINIIQNYLPGKGHIIITSRDYKLPGAIEVNVMNEEEALQLLSALIPEEIKSKATYEQDTKVLAKELGYLPLALSQAGAYILENVITVADYLEIYKSEKTDLLYKNIMPPGDEHKPVYVTWELSLNKIKKNNEGNWAVLILDILAYCYSEEVPRKWLGYYMKTRANSELENLKSAFGLLRKYSLIKLSIDTLSVHRLIHDWIKHKHGEKEKFDILENASSAIKEAYLYESKDVNFVKLLLPHLESINSLINIKPDSAQDAELKDADLLGILGDSYQTIGNFEKAKKIFGSLIHAKGKTSDNVNDSGNSSLLYKLGTVYIELGNYQKSKKLLEKALDIRKKRPEDNLEISKILDSLGWVHLYLCQYFLGEPILENALLIKRENYGSKHVETANTMIKLGWNYNLLGKFFDAETILEEALKIYRDNFGDEHVETAKPLNALGKTYLYVGYYDKAESLSKKASDLRKEYYGDKNILTANTSISLGWNYLLTGHYQLAKELFEDGLLIFKDQYGDDHLETAYGFNNLGLANYYLSEISQAQKMFEKSMFIYEKHLPENHIEIAYTMSNLSLIYLSCAEYEKCLSLYNNIIKILYEVYGNHENIFLLIATTNLANINRLLGNLHESESKLQKVLPLLKNYYKIDNAYTAKVKSNLALVHAAKNDLESNKKAIKLFEDSLSIFNKYLNVDHIDRIKNTQDLNNIKKNKANNKSTEKNIGYPLLFLF